MPQDNSLYDLLQFVTSSIAIALSVVIAVQATKREKKAEKKAYDAELRASKAEDIQHLLGEKETVGFAAFKILGTGLPQKSEDRAPLISAIMNACLFEKSDRARALLYYILEFNRAKYIDEFKKEFKKIEEIMNSMKEYKFEEKELDLSSSEIRLKAVNAIIVGEKPIKRQ